MIKHHRVQMRPVQVRAMFWVRESFSAGRAKSEIPAMTMAHYTRRMASQHNTQKARNHHSGRDQRTFMTGAQK